MSVPAKRNSRISQSVEEIFILSDQIVDELIGQLRADIVRSLAT